MSFSVDGSSSKDTVLRSSTKNLMIGISNTIKSRGQLFLNSFIVFKKADTEESCCDHSRASAYSQVEDKMVVRMKEFK